MNNIGKDRGGLSSITFADDYNAESGDESSTVATVIDSEETHTLVRKRQPLKPRNQTGWPDRTEARSQLKRLCRKHGMAIVALIAGVTVGRLYHRGDISHDGIGVQGIPPGQTPITWDRPPLHQLIFDFENGIISDVSFLMDFAIIGRKYRRKDKVPHPTTTFCPVSPEFGTDDESEYILTRQLFSLTDSKCSTTFHNDWIRQHIEVQMYEHEIHSLKNRRPAELVSLLYALPQGDYKRGYKAPVRVDRR